MNLGTQDLISVKQVVAAVERITGHKVPTHITARRPGDPPELVADPSLAEKLLKWKAKRSLDEIISTAWKWARKVLRIRGEARSGVASFFSCLRGYSSKQFVKTRQLCCIIRPLS